MKGHQGKEESIFQWFKDLFIWGGVGFLGAILLVTFSFQLLHVPSKSMVPTLEVGDRILVKKWAYGYGKSSLPHIAYRALYFLPNWHLAYAQPQRGDIVVFRPPQDHNVFYVKRIIGLPGDKVELKKNRLIINDIQLDYQPSEKDAITWRETTGKQRSYSIRLLDRFRDHAGPFFVPKNEFFVMGDNRPFSKDSRSTEVGTIPAASIVGRVDTILYSLRDNLKSFWRFWDWSGFDSERLVKKVRS